MKLLHPESTLFSSWLQIALTNFAVALQGFQAPLGEAASLPSNWPVVASCLGMNTEVHTAQRLIAQASPHYLSTCADVGREFFLLAFLKDERTNRLILGAR